MDEDVAEEAEIIPLQGPKRFTFAAIEYNNKTYSEVVLREPTIGALIEMRKLADPIAQMSKLITLMGKLPPQVVQQLPQGVLEAASSYFEGFSPPSPKAGTA
jgi:hypothetical protein